jgi:hypothetical protein
MPSRALAAALVSIAAAVVASGCFAAHFENGQYRCGPADACPAGFSCQAGLCVQGEGGGFDGGHGDGPGGIDQGQVIDASAGLDLLLDAPAPDLTGPPPDLAMDAPTGDIPSGSDGGTQADAVGSGDTGDASGPLDAVVVPPNLLVNGSFDDPDDFLSHWYMNVVAPGSGHADPDTSSPADGPVAALVTIDTADPLDWHVQLSQAGLALTAGNYQIGLWVRASEPRSMVAAIQQDHDPYTTYFYQSVDVTTDWMYVALQASVSADDECFVGFNLGNATGTVSLDGVSLQLLP